MDSFGSRNLRRILKIRWQDKVCTSSAREKTGQCPLSIILQKRRLTWYGHLTHMKAEKRRGYQSRPWTGSCRAKEDAADHGRLGAKPSRATSATWACHPRRQKLQHWTGPNGGRNCAPLCATRHKKIYSIINNANRSPEELCTNYLVLEEISLFTGFWHAWKLA